MLLERLREQLVQGDLIGGGSSRAGQLSDHPHSMFALGHTSTVPGRVRTS